MAGLDLPLGRLQSLGEVGELLVEQGAGSTLLEALAQHGAVRPVRGAERVIDVHIAELPQRLTELGRLGGVSLHLPAAQRQVCQRHLTVTYDPDV